MNPLGLVLLAALGIAGWMWCQRQPPHKRGLALLQLLLVLAAFVLIVLAITGRLNWLVGLVGAVLPFLRRLFPWIWRIGAWQQKRRRADRSDTHQPPPRSRQTNLTRAEALQILGLDESAKRDEILKAHQRLIQLNHPDRGGSDWLASRINAARDTLLEEMDQGN